MGIAARAQPALRWPALLIAFALPIAGVAILTRRPDPAKLTGRRLRLWACLATLAPVIAIALRVPPGLPTRPVWLALFSAPLAISVWRSLREVPLGGPPAVAGAPPPTLALKLHRWSAV